MVELSMTSGHDPAIGITSRGTLTMNARAMAAAWMVVCITTAVGLIHCTNPEPLQVAYYYLPG